MTRYFSLLAATLTLMSCSYISYSQVLPLARTAILGAKDIDVSEKFIAAQKYSFVKIELGRSAVAILTLSKIKNDVFEWVSSSGEKIYTYNGKIIKSENLSFNAHFYNFRSFSYLDNNADDTHYDIYLSNPDAYVSQTAAVEFRASSTQSKQGGKNFTESVVTRGFKWNFKNTYSVDASGRVSHSSQFIHPKLPELKIYFYYK